MQKKKIKVAILDDHKITLEGLEAILKNHPIIDLVATASRWDDFRRTIKHEQVDVAILDISLEEDKKKDKADGLEIAEYLMDVKPEMKCIMLSFSAEIRNIQRAQKIKVAGYLLKQETSDELIKAIQAVTTGTDPYFSQSVLTSWYKYRESAQTPALTPREKDILSYISRGHNVPQIHSMTGWNRAVIRTHKKHIMQKLDIHNVEKLVVWGRDNGYHELPLQRN